VTKKTTNKAGKPTIWRVVRPLGETFWRVAQRNKGPRYRGTPFATDPRVFGLATMLEHEVQGRQDRHLMGDDRDKQEPAALPRKQDDSALLAPVVHRSSDILQGRTEAIIEHEGVMYRLRLTSAGKLYMTK
jgi:hemin uptake protein HemP